jgi:hypothetical protein
MPWTQKTVFAPGQNAKRYLAGALHTPTGRVLWVSDGRKNSDERSPGLRESSLVFYDLSRYHAREELADLVALVG